MTVYRQAAPQKPMDGVLLDIGLGGAHLVLKGLLDRGAFELELKLDKEPLRLPARLARDIGADAERRSLYHYGVRFTTHLGNIHLLQRVVDGVRGSSWAKRTGSPGGELKRDYWNL